MSGAVASSSRRVRNFAAVVQLRVLEEVHDSASGSVFGRSTAEDDAPHPHVDEGSGAHGAGLFRDVEVAVGEAVVFQHALGLRDGEHLGVGGGVFERLHLVVRAGDDAAFVDDHCAHGHLLALPRAVGLAEGFAHKVVVAVKVYDFIHDLCKFPLRDSGDTLHTPPFQTIRAYVEHHFQDQ